MLGGTHYSTTAELSKHLGMLTTNKKAEAYAVHKAAIAFA